MEALIETSANTGKALWSGRKEINEVAGEYWFQVVEFDMEPTASSDFVLLGYPSDQGVSRNQGRAGAKAGPNAIRQHLAKLPVHFTGKRVFDGGDVCDELDVMEEAQFRLTNSVSQVIQSGNMPIVMGGGHDLAYGHFKGIVDGVPSDSKIGVVNFDAHFDLRKVDGAPNSGTPFYQVFEEFGDQVAYFPIGIQRQANTKRLFEEAKLRGVDYALAEACVPGMGIEQQLSDFIDSVDYLYLTVDLDVFSVAYSPGVSASSPTGLSPEVVLPLLYKVVRSGKLVSCDVSELNPSFDVDNVTAKLAARIIDSIVFWS